MTAQTSTARDRHADSIADDFTREASRLKEQADALRKRAQKYEDTARLLRGEKLTGRRRVAR